MDYHTTTTQEEKETEEKMNARAKARSTKEIVNRAERRGRVLDLAAGGLSLRQIGEKVGCSYRTVQNDLQKICEEKVNEVDLVKYRARETRLLEALRANRMEAAMKGDDRAISSVLATHDRMVRLWGLAAPTEIRHANPDGSALRFSEPPIIQFNVTDDTGAEDITEFVDAEFNEITDIPELESD